MCTHHLNQERAEAFANRMMGALNEAALTLMASIGHRTGLFDKMVEMPPATSEEIAAAAGLAERYVREWLGAMTTSRVIEFDAATGNYSLPAEHAAFLTRAAGADNIACPAQWIAVLGYVEDQVTEAFTHGNGVPYEAYNRFHEVMAEESGNSVVAGLSEHVLPVVPGLVGRLNEGINVLDVGCGSGRAMVELARQFPNSRFNGYDMSPQAIAAGQAYADAAGVTNIRLLQQDVAAFNEPAAYDLITAFDAIHDQAKPDQVLANINSALRPGGLFLMQDIRGSSHVENNMDGPLAPFLYTISCMHCMSVSLANGGPGLGAMWGKEKALEMLAAAGFGDVEVHELPHDIMNYWYVAAK